MLDLKIVGGMVVDGHGGPAFLADVGVKDGRVALIEDLSARKATRSIDARGKVVCPGFVDIHTHSDFGLLVDPRGVSQLVQGVTTEVAGNCGKSAWGFPQPRKDAPESNKTRIVWRMPEDVDLSWKNAKEYARAMRARGTGTNIVPLVGHSVIRSRILGDEPRAPTPEEQQRMCAMVAEAMDEGFAGLSTGLQYEPGAFAKTDEVIQLAKVVHQYGGIYTSHLRSYGDRLVDAVLEALRVGREAQVPVQISHLGVARTQDRLMDDALAEIDRARRDGISVEYDVMPYSTVATWWAPRAVFPAWVYPHAYDIHLVPDWRKGDCGLLPQVLADPEGAARLRVEVEGRRLASKKGEEELRVFESWEHIELLGVGKNSPNERWIGRSIAEIARTQSREPVDVYFDLVLSEGAGLVTIRHMHSEETVRKLLQRPGAIICSDNVSGDPDKPEQFLQFWPLHPRVVSNFPQVLGRYVRREKVLTLEDAIHRMTLLPARRMGLGDRGQIRPKCAADLVVLDPDIVDGYFQSLDPTRLPTGMEYVIVNGQVSVEHGQPTSQLAGSFLLAERGKRSRGGNQGS